MRLTSLKLLNFRKFRQEEIEFSDDFLVIFWKNWAWKSSIIDAIGFALFRDSSNVFTRWKLDTLKSYEADSKEWSKIELNFEIWLENYKVVRILHKWYKSHSSDFIEETKDTLIFDKEFIHDPTPVTNYIESLLWIDKNIFLRSVFARQKDISVLSNTNSSDQRKSLISNILWINKIENLAYEYKKLYKENEKKLNTLKEFISDFNEKEIRLIIKDFEKKIKEINNELSLCEDEKLKKEKTFEGKKLEFEKLEKIKNEYDKITKNLWLAEIELKNTSENLIKNKKEIALLRDKSEFHDKNKSDYWKFEKVEKLFLDLKVLAEKRALKNTKILNLKNQNEWLETLEEEIRSIFRENNLEKWDKIDTKVKKISENIEKIEKNLNDKLSLVTKISSEMEMVAKDWKELTVEFEKINELWEKWECPTCFRALEDYAPKILALIKNKIEEKREEWQKLNLNILALSKEKEAIDQALKCEKDLLNSFNKLALNLEKMFTNKENFLKNITNLEAEIKEIWNIDLNEETAKKIKEEYLILKEKVDKLKIIFSEIQKIPILEEDFNDINKKITLIKKEIHNFEEKIKVLNYDVITYNKVKETYLNSQKELLDLVTIIWKMNLEKSNLVNEFSKNKAKLDNYLEQSLKVDSEKSKLLETWLIKEILNEYKTYLLVYLKPIIEEVASEYFRILTNWKYSSIELTDDYLMEIEGKSLELYSGWEKDLANLCLRLALSQNLTNNTWKNQINFMVLDEVLWSQDFERRNNILASLKWLEDKFSQIILISHVDEIKDIASSLIEVESINKYESKISLK